MVVAQFEIGALGESCEFCAMDSAEAAVEVAIAAQSRTVPMKSGFRTIYFVLCLVPWIILPHCFGQLKNPLDPFEALFDHLFVGFFLEFLSTLLGIVGVILAIFAPRGLKIGLLISAGIAAIPGLWILSAASN
jgi:hypothetical protein